MPSACDAAALVLSLLAVAAQSKRILVCDAAPMCEPQRLGRITHPIDTVTHTHNEYSLIISSVVLHDKCVPPPSIPACIPPPSHSPTKSAKYTRLMSLHHPDNNLIEFKPQMRAPARIWTPSSRLILQAPASSFTMAMRLSSLGACRVVWAGFNKEHHIHKQHPVPKPSLFEWPEHSELKHIFEVGFSRIAAAAATATTAHAAAAATAVHPAGTTLLASCVWWELAAAHALQHCGTRLRIASCLQQSQVWHQPRTWASLL